jgi:hypothetical protein
MMASGARGMMKLRATISRKDRLEDVNGVMQGTQDRYGHGTTNPANPTGWSQTYAALPCWVFHQNGRRIVGNERTVSDEKSVIAVPLRTDLQEGDRVDQVADRLGNVLYGPLQVTHVTHKIRYIDAELLEVDRGAN